MWRLVFVILYGYAPDILAIAGVRNKKKYIHSGVPLALPAVAPVLVPRKLADRASCKEGAPGLRVHTVSLNPYLQLPALCAHAVFWPAEIPEAERPTHLLKPRLTTI